MSRKTDRYKYVEGIRINIEGDIDMNITKRLELELDEYVITPGHPEAEKYKVTYDGKELKDVIGVIRKKRLEVSK